MLLRPIVAALDPWVLSGRQTGVGVNEQEDRMKGMNGLCGLGLWLVLIVASASFSAFAGGRNYVGYKVWSSADCRALVRWNDAYCDTGDCRALIRSNDAYCQSGDCRASVRKNDAYCDTKDCKAVIRNNDAYCDSSDCRAIIRNNDAYCKSNSCKAIIRDNDAYCG
jgi:hypothetical protein